MKKTYIIPALNVREISLENMLAVVSGTSLSGNAAVQDNGMETKSERAEHNVWDEVWNRNK